MYKASTPSSHTAPSPVVTSVEDAGQRADADKVSDMETTPNADAVPMERNERTATPAATGTSLVAPETATDLGIKSSPPPFPAPVLMPPAPKGNNDTIDDGSKSDSEAETVLLPGVDGFSPSKIRKKREIKLEERIDEPNVDNETTREADSGDKEPTSGPTAGLFAKPAEAATSLLGKRKRSKHGGLYIDDNNVGASSGLSSVPSSPVHQSRSHLSKQVGSGSDVSRSPSPFHSDSGLGESKPSRNGSVSNHDSDKEPPKRHRRRSSAANVSERKQSREPRKVSPSTLHRHTHSPSPTRHNGQARAKRAVSTGASTSLGSRKKSVPAPLKPVDRRSAEYSSDESDGVDFTYPRRRSKQHNNAPTPPTGDLAYGKMPGHRRKPDRYGRTPLTDACEEGDYERASSLLVEYPEDLDTPDAAGNTPLQCASLNGHDDIVQLLLKHKCNVNCKNDLGDSPLLDAVENGHLEVVKLLLDAGVDPRARNRSGEEPIMKINEKEDNANEIRTLLMNARAQYAQAQPSAANQTQQADRHDWASRRPAGRVRGNRTGHNQLYTPFTVAGLRNAAANGDLQTVGNIVSVLEQGSDDAQSLLNAAKGGHDEILQILLAVGNANPDPPPLRGAGEYSTPMLAAIGGDNMKVIELLLGNVDEGRFDPTRTFADKNDKDRKRTYYEIAEDRKGPLWREEVKVLKEACDNFKAKKGDQPSPRSSSQTAARSHKKRGSVSERSADARRRKGDVDTGPKKETESSSPVRRATGRSKKDASENGDHQASKHHDDASSRATESDRAVSPAGSEPTKPRRKLISGKDLRGDKEKMRPSSSAPPDVMSTKQSEDKQGQSTEKKGPPRTDSKHAHDLIGDRPKHAKRDESSDRASSIRGESPIKRPRSTTPSSETNDKPLRSGGEYLGTSKRRRLETDVKLPRPSENVRSSSPEQRRGSLKQDTLMLRQSTSKDQSSDARRSKDNGAERKRSASADGRAIGRSTPMEPPARKDDKSGAADSRPSSRSSPGVERKQLPSADEIAARKKVQREAKEARDKAEAEREAKIKQEQEAAELEAQEKAKRDKAAQEKAEAEAKAKREEEELLAKQRAEENRRREEEDRAALEAQEKRRLEEQAEREKREAEERERARLEDIEAKKRAEEDRKRAVEEQQRLQREEAEKKRAAQRAERLRIHQEQEAARLAKLPRLLRWFDSVPNPASAEIARMFRLIQGVRYDTIRPEASGSPDAREQWLLNTHACLLLGEKDLQLSRYTAWEHIPATALAKEGLLRVEGDMYAMLRSDLRLYNPALAEYNKEGPFQPIPPDVSNTERASAHDLLMNMDLFFVSISDFMSIVPKFPHLRGLQLDVQYHEVLPDVTWLPHLVVPARWQQDPDADEAYLGFAPGIKNYVNGNLVGQANAKKAVTAKRPFPARRVPRLGLTEIHETDPEYEQVAREQGLIDEYSHRTTETENRRSNDEAFGANGHVVGAGMNGSAAPSELRKFDTLSPEVINGSL